MTVAMIQMAAHLCRDLPPERIVSFNEIGSEGAVLRTVVPGPMRGPGSWLIARNGDAAGYDGTYSLARDLASVSS